MAASYSLTHYNWPPHFHCHCHSSIHWSNYCLTIHWNWRCCRCCWPRPPQTIAVPSWFSAVQNQRTNHWNAYRCHHLEWHRSHRRADQNHCPNRNSTVDLPVWCRRSVSTLPACCWFDFEDFAVARSERNACWTFQWAIDRRWWAMIHRYLYGECERCAGISPRPFSNPHGVRESYPNPVYWFHCSLAEPQECPSNHIATEFVPAQFSAPFPLDPWDVGDKQITGSPVACYDVAAFVFHFLFHCRSCNVWK